MKRILAGLALFLLCAIAYWRMTLGEFFAGFFGIGTKRDAENVASLLVFVGSVLHWSGAFRDLSGARAVFGVGVGFALGLGACALYGRAQGAELFDVLTHDLGALSLGLIVLLSFVARPVVPAGAFLETRRLSQYWGVAFGSALIALALRQRHTPSRGPWLFAELGLLFVLPSLALALTARWYGGPLRWPVRGVAYAGLAATGVYATFA